MKELLKKKTVQIGLLIIVLLVAAVIIGINAQSAQRQKKYNGHIEAAQKYLTELDYEQAIAEYTLAYEIEPSEEVLDALEQTYLAYAQSYVDAGDYERAISILEEGYEQTGRESLRERIKELQAEMEEALRRQSEDEQEELWQSVHSGEFRETMNKLRNHSSHLGYFQVITDEQLKEMCRPFINSLEQYKALYPEDYSFDQELLDLYIVLGEYETCIEFKQKLDESGLDWDTFPLEHMRDEYGRIYWRNNKGIEDGALAYGDGLIETSDEFDSNGRLIKHTNKADGFAYPGEKSETTYIYEYDEGGRVSRTSESCYALIVDGYLYQNIESVVTYEYNQTGFTEYGTTTRYSDMNHGNAISYTGYSRDCVVDEYGQMTYGEPYDTFIEEL